MMPREAAQDIVIEGVQIPKGTQIDMTPAVVHTSTDIWGQTATMFDADRWDNLVGDAANPYAWEPFGQGPRTCPGKNFALAEIKAILVELIRQWRFIGVERSDGTEVLLSNGDEEIGKGIKVENPALTYCPAGGLRVRFERL